MKKNNVIETFNLLQIDKNVKKVFDADISARIPYFLHCCVYNFDREVWVEDDILYNYDLGGNCQTLKLLNERGTCLMYYQIRPYLRPMSSMTEEELHEYNMHLLGITTGVDAMNFMIWIYQHHLDILHLIEKGLALEAPKDMYNIKEK